MGFFTGKLMGVYDVGIATPRKTIFLEIILKIEFSMILHLLVTSLPIDPTIFQ